MLFPSRCAVCLALGASPCAPCRAGFGPALPAEPPPGLDGVVALYAYRGGVRALLGALKYRNNRACLRWAAVELADAWQRQDLRGVLTWAPTNPGRARRRGFDQSALLARALARELRRRGEPVVHRPLLRRLPGPTMTGLAARERRDRVRFQARSPGAGRSGDPLGRPFPPSVVVLDDVITTGATLGAAAAALRAAGAVQVVGLAVARTPAPAGRGCAGQAPPDGSPSGP